MMRALMIGLSAAVVSFLAPFVFGIIVQSVAALAYSGPSSWTPGAREGLAIMGLMMAFTLGIMFTVDAASRGTKRVDTPEQIM